MTKILFRGTIKNSSFEPKSPEYYRHHLKKFEGKEISIAVVPNKKVRSDKQHRAYWWWLGLLSEHTGHTTDELHRLFKGLYLPKKFINYKGKQYALATSTTELSVSEFIVYMEHVAREAAELGCVLPEPDELYNI